MKKNRILTVLALITLLSSCESASTTQVTNPNDYQKYLETTNTEKQAKEQENLDFWNRKYAQQPEQHPYLFQIANANSQLFSTTGDIEYLLATEYHLKAQIKKYKNATNLRALAKNYISQHRFQEALVLLKEAEENGEQLSSTQKMLFDVHLELGNYEKAKSYLSNFSQFNDFDYLIRAAKWNDTQGNLSTAIVFLEKALDLSVKTNKKSLMIWSYTNLADFYGHNNQIKKSYEHYLKALSLEPSNAYAKKGIAWIVYSYEKNSEEARRILTSIQEYHESPDYYLFLAELDEFDNDEISMERNIELFMSHSQKAQYGKMYHQHNVKLLLDKQVQSTEFQPLIDEEIANRPTPETYDLLAWANYTEGNIKQSLDIAKKFVIGKTHEPEVLYHLAEIYKSNEMHAEAQELKKELMGSAFEIGPILLSKVQNI